MNGIVTENEMTGDKTLAEGTIGENPRNSKGGTKKRSKSQDTRHVAVSNATAVAPRIPDAACLAFKKKDRGKNRCSHTVCMRV